MSIPSASNGYSRIPLSGKFRRCWPLYYCPPSHSASDSKQFVTVHYRRRSEEEFITVLAISQAFLEPRSTSNYTTESSSYDPP
jgi:hypothetical protein